MVRGALVLKLDWLGTVQLRHAGEFVGETLVVPRTDIAQRRRVPFEFRHQWEFSGEGIGEQSRPEEYLAQIRGTSVSLQVSLVTLYTV